MRRLVVPATALFFALGSLGEVRAEHLVVALSTHQVQINSSFVGADLVLFGAIERDEKTVARSGGYDIVVRVTGPPQTEVTFRKGRVLGIWVDRESRVFLDAPGYLAMLVVHRPSGTGVVTFANSYILRGGNIGVTLPLSLFAGAAEFVETVAPAPEEPHVLERREHMPTYADVQAGRD